MADLYVFDPDDNLLTVLSSDAEGACLFYEAPFEDELNREPTFQFKATADHPDASYIISENQVGFFDKDDVFRLFIIRNPEWSNGKDGPEIIAECVSWMQELEDEPLEDIRAYNVTAETAATRVLSKTRIKVGIVAELGINSANFYYISTKNALEIIINTWGGELRDRVEIDDNGIKDRYIDILPRRGQDSGHRWYIDEDIESLNYRIESSPKTALYGRGSSLQTEDGGFTRKITFADVEWKVSEGDPVDKPLGQEWVGDPQALQKYGRKNKDGTRRHRVGFYEDGEQEDPKVLLEETYRALQEETEPMLNVSMTVHLLESISGYEHRKARLGDTTTAIDDSFARPVELESRIIKFKYDVADPDKPAEVEIGSFLDFNDPDDRIRAIEARLNEKSGVWSNPQIPDMGPIDDYDIIDSPPPSIKGLTADGLFKTIKLSWGFNAAIHVAAYELYGSQVPDFTPDASNLLFRGKTGGFVHNAGTNEQWYFVGRTMNTHGEYSDFSDVVTAQTARIVTDDILFGSVTADLLADLSVSAKKLAEQAVTNAKLAPGAVTNEKLDDGSVDFSKITNGAVGTVKLADLAVTVGKIVDGAVNNKKLGDLSVSVGKIVDGAINNLKLGDNAVTVSKIVDQAITNAKLGAGAVATANIQNGAVNNQKLNDLAVTAEKLAEGSVEAGKIANGAVGNLKLDALAVDASKLAAGAVSTTKIVDDAINNAKLASNAVALANLQNGAVNNAKLADLAVDAAKLADSSVEATKIAKLAVGTAAIQDLAITSAKVQRLAADKVTIGSTTSFASNYDPTTKETPTGAQSKATSAKNDAISTAASDATTKADSAKSGAISAAAADATTKANNAKSEAISTASGDAATKANSALVSAKAYRDLWAYPNTSFIDGGDIYTNSVTANAIATETITAASGILADLAVTSAKIAGLAVGNAAIANGAITNAKIGSLQVDNAKIANGAIDSAKIANLAVGNAAIANGAITNAKIGNLAVDNAKIVNVHGDKILANTIQANRVLIGDFSNFASWNDKGILESSPFVLKPGYLEYVTDLFRTSSGSYKIRPKATGNMLHKVMPVIPGERIYVEAWVRLESNAWDGSGNNSKLRVGNADGGAHIFSAQFKGIGESSTGWAKASGSALIPEGVSKVNFSIGNDGTNYSIFVDDIIIAKQTKGELIVDGAITTEKLVANAITANELAAYSVTSNKINANSVFASHIYSRTITTEEIASWTIEARNIKSNTITASSGIIANLAVTNAMIANLAVDTAKLQTLSVTSTKIGIAAVGTLAVADAAITTAKIGNLAVGNAQLDYAAVTSAKIANLAVDNAKIASVDASKINANELSAISANLGKVTAGLVDGVELVSKSPSVGGNVIFNGTTIRAGKAYSQNISTRDSTYNTEEGGELSTGSLRIYRDRITKSTGYALREQGISLYADSMYVTHGEKFEFAGLNNRYFEFNVGASNSPLSIASGGTSVLKFFANGVSGSETVTMEALRDIVIRSKSSTGSVTFSGIKTNFNVGPYGMNVLSIGSSGNAGDPTVVFQKELAKRFAFDGDVDMQNNNLININSLRINDPGKGEGLTFLNGNGFEISESPYNNRVGGNGAGELTVFQGGRNVFSFGEDSRSTFIRSDSIFNRTYTYGSNLYITSNGVLGRDTSSRKYKYLEQEIPKEEAYKILKLKPMTWFDKTTIDQYASYLTNGGSLEDLDIPYMERVPGAIAEDVADLGLDLFLNRGMPDEQGNRPIQGLKYERIPFLFIPILNDNVEDIKVLKQENEAKGRRIAELEEKYLGQEERMMALEEKINQMGA